MGAADARSRLRSIDILATLSEAELNTLADQVTWLSVLPDQQVVAHLSGGAQVYFIVEGIFRIRILSPTGRLVAFRQMQAGGYFGEIAALTGSPRTVSVVAETEGLLAECPADAFLALMRGNGGFAQAVSTALARTVVLLTDRVFELATLEVRFRIYAELLRLAHDGEKQADGIVVRPAPTQEMIAAAIGAQREAVTREMRYLAQEGIIRQGRREFTIVEPDRLRELVQRRGGLTATRLADWHF